MSTMRMNLVGDLESGKMVGLAIAFDIVDLVLLLSWNTVRTSRVLF